MQSFLIAVLLAAAVACTSLSEDRLMKRSGGNDPYFNYRRAGRELSRHAAGRRRPAHDDYSGEEDIWSAGWYAQNDDGSSSLPAHTSRAHVGPDYDLHEYLYAKGQFENTETGEITQHEWNMLVSGGNDAALSAKAAYREKALYPLRMIRYHYQCAQKKAEDTSEKEAEYDYCREVCGNENVDKNTFQQSTDTNILEARAMFQRVKNLPWNEEY